MLIQVGSTEMLLSDSMTVTEKARAKGGKVRLSIYEDMFHVFQMAGMLIPESKKAWAEVEKFIEII
jgi:acetyl esterase/lipase